jgi:hypothetical protein
MRRHKGIVGGFVLLGLAAGVGYAVLNPPQQTSSALVILPAPKPNIQTDTLIAESDPVLTAALPKIGHGMTLTALHKAITNVTNLPGCAKRKAIPPPYPCVTVEL